MANEGGGEGDSTHLSAPNITSLLLVPSNMGPCGGGKEKKAESRNELEAPIPAQILTTRIQTNSRWSGSQGSICIELLSGQ